ncbi:S46 family peptidase [Porphyromonas canoris]|uniref:Dipeptidyl-peptidase n=1 Tax=Porphyromonas canoris TaxID=36875 RepID=A0ABR4XJM1_9PORP|nr:S46 family peptidase [Porphyromonas canoris]KGN91591.1 hypothetical protein HQ43_05600 [Porphyromonas canoris]
MKKTMISKGLNGLIAAVILLVCSGGYTSVRADEGMWLLPLMSKQNYNKMVKKGLKLRATDIYNPNGTSIKDAIVIFDRGCTGSIVSDKGLVFTNHHCGYDQIRAHSTVDQNYLRDGFYANSMKDELPNPGTTVTFTERIEDVTKYVDTFFDKHKNLSPKATEAETLKLIGETWYKEIIGGEMPFGTQVSLRPFYEGNKHYLFVQKVYHDIRLVAAPPSCVGKYGEDTDNWVWPRHSGDFSVFRVYTDKNGNPAKYDPDNIPLKPRRYLQVASKPVAKGEFAMVIGFPGRTNHFYTTSEVVERRDIDNDIRIRMREIRQNNLLEEMRKDEALNIMYASKYAYSTNAYKNAIGSNWAINKMQLEKVKQAQTDKLIRYAEKNNKPEYKAAVATIERMVKNRAHVRKQMWLIDEALLRAVEAISVPIIPKEEITKPNVEKVLKAYDDFFNKDYSRMLDVKVMKAMIRAYMVETDVNDLPGALKDVKNVEKYVEDLWNTTIYRSRESYREFLFNFSPEVYLKDPLVRLVTSVRNRYNGLKEALAQEDKSFAEARKIYVKGLLEMEGELNLWPDANSTLRYTFGKVEGYSPKDNVFYGHSTTMEGVLEKYDPNNPEYALLPDIKALAEKPENRKKRVNFCATTHTTGGNSGSPVIDAYGRLIGLNFDRNWEGVGGDIQYLPNYQRSIICDVDYVLFILNDYLGADRLIKEMKIRR